MYFGQFLDECFSYAEKVMSLKNENLSIRKFKKLDFKYLSSF